MLLYLLPAQADQGCRDQWSSHLFSYDNMVENGMFSFVCGRVAYKEKEYPLFLRTRLLKMIMT